MYLCPSAFICGLIKGKVSHYLPDKFWKEYLISLIFATEAEKKKGTKTFPSSFIHYEHRRTNTGTGAKSEDID
jgi:hypothetical protein